MNTLEDFRKIIRELIEEMKVKKVTEKDSDLILSILKKEIKMLENAREGFIHEWVQIDSRGRVIIPYRFRNLLHLKPYDRLDCHIYPNLDNPKGLLLFKEK
jgi:hypothetical protein